MAANRITVKSPLGPLTVFEQGGKIAALDYGRAGRDSPTPLLLAAAQQIDAYFHCA
jgi:hypothetical protein